VRVLYLIDGSWAQWTTLINSPHLTGLRELHLHGQQIAGFTIDRFSAVLRAPAVRGLQRLDLSVPEYATVTFEELFRVLTEAALPEIRELDLRADEMHPQRFVELFSAPIASRLTTFRTAQYLDDHALGGLARAKEVPSLRALAFGTVYASQEELPAVFAAPLLRHVASLEITGLRDEGFRALVASPLAERLRVLALPQGHFTPAAFREALASGRLRNLLFLQATLWPEREESASAPGLENLRHIDLTGAARPTIATLDALAASRHLPNLRLITTPALSGPGLLNEPAHLKGFAAKYGNRFAILIG
jgi:hypothetical protein